MLSIYLMDDQWPAHMGHIFQTERQKTTREQCNKIHKTFNTLEALYQTIVYHNLIFVYFHEHKNPIHIVEFVRVPYYMNHKYINVSHQLSVYR